MAKATGSSGFLVAFMVGMAGVVLVVSAVKGARPGATLQSLLQTGKLPAKGAGYGSVPNVPPKSSKAAASGGGGGARVQ